MEETLDLKQLPTHVGIIMDGNGRWATQRNKPRTAGHREGLEAAKRIVRTAAELGIRYLSLYTFSTENWKRTMEEVSFLMSLIVQHLKKEMDFYVKNNIRVVHSGNLKALPQDVQAEILSVTSATRDFEGLTVNLAINYGGRDEIVRACKRWAASSLKEGEPFECTEATFASFLDQPELPDADLIIRTAYELRMSNFLLWQAAYAELYFSQKLWPDFTPEDFKAAIAEYQRRIRKFGGLT
ncbi:MAG TPA: polyprenyl diphosphate synthase [Spirochaetia bacterium]|nr:polyprenyl diphosphate synthase [Spirochaetia bacterium]